MTNVFVSYASVDHFFVELLAAKLDGESFTVWRDSGAIRAGDDWRRSIEEGIKASAVVLVALSPHSASSPYVTFEWAYALGLGRPVITLKLADCAIHPRLEPIQYLDFSYPKALPWDELLKRLRDVEYEQGVLQSATGHDAGDAGDGKAIGDIMAYLERHGFTMASFDRLRQRVVKTMSEEDLRALVDSNPTVFRHATLRDGKRGLAKVVP